MSQRNTIADSRRRRRLFTATWMLALAIVMIGLIYWEKTAILYILATLSVTALLGVVALADLGGPEKASTDTTS
jgi:hypothetical protein